MSSIVRIVLAVVGVLAGLAVIALFVVHCEISRAIDEKDSRRGYPAITTPLNVTTRPSGATLYVDDVSWGPTPVVVPAATVGADVALRAELPGYQPATRRVRIVDRVGPVHLELTPAP